MQSMQPVSTPASSVRNIDEASSDVAYATIVLAFGADPAARWTWPRADVYQQSMSQASRAFSSKGFALGTAYEIGGFAGVALWLPPDVSADEEALASLMERTARAEIKRELAQVFERMASFHPREPHWYLPMIGVDPSRQGQRLGDKLMSHALARCDADGLPAYLESSNPRNIPFYERQGFEALGRIQVGSSPTIVPMLRKARARK
jgi:ribosomal protein S18 acetylase RimI-like enzyme